MIVIIDYGVGNVASIQNMLRKIGVKSRISAQPSAIAAADKLILPGVGNFGHGMLMLTASGLVPILTEQVKTLRKPILGICLGMQMMTYGSEESSKAGLGWIDGFTRKFISRPGFRVPHMGWNIIRPRVGARLFDATQTAEERFYFVHSYHVCMAASEAIAAYCDYGDEFTAGFESDNLFGVQFHPEKSHQFGKELLRRFATL